MLRLKENGVKAGAALGRCGKGSRRDGDFHGGRKLRG